ncbi:MAG: hypothetical protein Q7J30_00610 [Candidatus Azambacteria bacterium]|nr:hypothetical protein [Candidatus Azambacteria bacterium]
MEEFNWKIEESDFMPKTTEWFWALGIFAFAIIVFAVLLKNYLLIIIVALAAFIIYGNKNKPPEIVNFRLDNDGLYIEGKFHPYDGFESFWIFPDTGWSASGGINSVGENREFVLRYSKRLMPLLIIPFHNGDELEIRKILSGYLPENEEKESLIDLLRKRFF